MSLLTFICVFVFHAVLYCIYHVHRETYKKLQVVCMVNFVNVIVRFVLEMKMEITVEVKSIKLQEPQYIHVYVSPINTL
jgi:hypothetical protein